MRHSQTVTSNMHVPKGTELIFAKHPNTAKSYHGRMATVGENFHGGFSINITYETPSGRIWSEDSPVDNGRFIIYKPFGFGDWFKSISKPAAKSSKGKKNGESKSR